MAGLKALDIKKYFTQSFSSLNPDAKVSRCKIDDFVIFFLFQTQKVFFPFSSFYWILWQSLYGAHFWLFNLIHLLLSLEHFLFLWQVIHKLNKLLIWRIENQTIYCFLKMHKHNLLLFHHWVPWFFHLKNQIFLRELHFKPV